MAQRASSNAPARHACLWRSSGRPACLHKRGFDVGCCSKARSYDQAICICATAGCFCVARGSPLAPRLSATTVVAFCSASWRSEAILFMRTDSGVARRNRKSTRLHKVFRTKYSAPCARRGRPLQMSKCHHCSCETQNGRRRECGNNSSATDTGAQLQVREL